MPRIARMVVKGEPAVYHVMSRTALDGYVIGDIEKEFLLKLIKQLSSVYFTEVFGFCLMGNHFHLLVRMYPGEGYSDEEIKRRFKLMYGDRQGHDPSDIQVCSLREKWASLSEYVKEIKQTFSRFYNKLRKRRGFFWSERFKSVIVDNGETLINCLAYIDLNPIRAGLVKRPEDYRWNSIGYHIQTNNKDDFLSMDFGLKEFGPSEIRSSVTSEFHPDGIITSRAFHRAGGAGIVDEGEHLKYYRRFVYEKGCIDVSKVGQPSKHVVEEERKKGFEIGIVDRFRYRTRYFTDSGIIGTKVFVSRYYQVFKHYFSSKHEKLPKMIGGLNGVYSLKRLSEKRTTGQANYPIIMISDLR